ncbi:fibrinogen C domain containing 1 [Cricetulus griseus]
MVHERWKTVGGASQLEDRPRDKPQVTPCPGCIPSQKPRSAAEVTCLMLDQEEHRRGGIGASGGDLKMYWAKCGLPGSAGPGDQLPAAPGKAQLSVLVLFLNHAHAPGTPPPPVISTGSAGANSALVTVERADSSHLSLLIDPRCPDLTDSFARLEGVQASMLRALSDHQAQPRLDGAPELLDALADQLPRLLARASELQAECAGLRKGHSMLGQGLSTLQSEQGRLVQVFQRREDGSVNFFRGWEAYREGFGKLTGEHWLGLKRIHALTTQAAYELHVDLEDFDNGTAYAHYGSFGVGLFSVDPEEDGYPLTVADYSGTAGDSLLKHSGMRFTTKDRDSDHSENNCAAFYRGAWWYRNCHTSNLNGQYLRGAHASYADGIEWSSWTGWQYSLKFSEMKMRSLHTLPYLLLLPLSTCFPLLDRRGPTDIDDIRAKMSWANPVEERRPHSVQDPFLWLRVPQPQALLVVAKELQSSHREHTGFRLGRRDRSSQAAGFLPTDAEKASRPLGTLAEELSSYSRRKGGFSFRFGR